MFRPDRGGRAFCDPSGVGKWADSIRWLRASRLPPATLWRTSGASRLQPVLPPAQRLHSARGHHERVLDPYAQLALGKVEARLDGDDVALLDRVVVAGVEGERRLFVDLQSDAVAQTVDIAGEGGGVRAECLVAERFEVVADESLIG